MGRLVSDLLILARADAGRTGARASDLSEIGAGRAVGGEPVADGHRLPSCPPRDRSPVVGNPDELHRWR